MNRRKQYSEKSKERNREMPKQYYQGNKKSSRNWFVDQTANSLNKEKYEKRLLLECFCRRQAKNMCYFKQSIISISGKCSNLKY